MERIEAIDFEEVLKINSLLDEIEDIFDLELGIPGYYEEKNLHGKWQTKNGKQYRLF